MPEGDHLATTDPDLAAKLLSERLERYEAAKRAGVILKLKGSVPLSDLAERHLIKKAQSGRITGAWLAAVEHHLQTAVDYFEYGGFRSDLERDPAEKRKTLPRTPRDVATIKPEHVRDYIGWLRGRKNKRSGTLSDATVRLYLVSLSNLYKRAQEEGAVLPGQNPASVLMEKPQAARHEAKWLEVDEAALLLESARLHKPRRSDGILCLYPLVATMLLTGARVGEVLGLAVGDVDFKRRTVTIRPHPWRRRLKTRTSLRAVPLWPQLSEILGPYVKELLSDERTGEVVPLRPADRLLFPSQQNPDGMIDDMRKAMDAIAERAGWKPGEIRPKMFRHTYCAARLQTLDGGAPVSPFTVGRELGHGGDALVKRVYGHLGDVRHRSAHVEFRIEKFERRRDHPEIRRRLELLRSMAG